MEAIFIRTLDGYKIVPTGGGWKIAGQDLAGAEVNCLAISPGRRNVVYAGLRGGRRDDNDRPTGRKVATYIELTIPCVFGFL
jgi:hypothetical protein